MKRLLCGLLLAASSMLSAWDCCEWASCGSCAPEFDAEFRVGYFHPQNKRFRKIYKNGGVDYGLEVNARLPCDWNNFKVFASVNYFQKDGHSFETDFSDSTSGDFSDSSSGSGSGSFRHRNKTNIYLVPIGLGLKYQFNFCEGWSFIVGGGGTATYLKIHDHSEFVKQHTSKWGWGGVVKSALQYNFTDCFYVDAFFDYYWTTVNKIHHHGVQTRNANISGFRTGGGIGVSF